MEGHFMVDLENLSSGFPVARAGKNPPATWDLVWSPAQRDPDKERLPTPVLVVWEFGMDCLVHRSQRAWHDWDDFLYFSLGNLLKSSKACLLSTKK